MLSDGLSPHPSACPVVQGGCAGLTGAAGGGARGPGAEAPEELGLLDLVLAVGRPLDGVLVAHTGVGLLEQQLWGHGTR